MKRVVIASNNAHKAAEIRAILDMEGWEFVTLAEAGISSDPVEDAESFEGNARIKALSAHIAGNGCAALADDSGLVVDALGGAPGVRSARYAGEDADDAENNAKLLAELAGVPEQERTARFACSLVLVDEDGTETTAQGAVEGIIADAPCGEGGFGYDPLFLPNEHDHRISFGCLPAEDKNAISHRGRALASLRRKLAGEDAEVC